MLAVLNKIKKNISEVYFNLSASKYFCKPNEILRATAVCESCPPPQYIIIGPNPMSYPDRCLIPETQLSSDLRQFCTAASACV